MSRHMTISTAGNSTRVATSRSDIGRAFGSRICGSSRILPENALRLCIVSVTGDSQRKLKTPAHLGNERAPTDAVPPDAGLKGSV